MAPPRERAFLAQPLPVAGGRVIVSPFQFYADGDDNLRIEAWNSVTGATLAVHGRWFNEHGEQQPFAHTLALTADRARNRVDVALAKGYLVNLVAFVTGASPLIGQTFVKLSLIRGLTGATVLLGTLLQGYTTAEQALAWPGSPMQSSLEGGGAIRTITGTNPAAGVDFSETVPTGARWEFLSIRAQLVTSAAAGTRNPLLNMATSGVEFVRSTPPIGFGPSITAECAWGAGMPSVSQAGYNGFQSGTPVSLQLPAAATVSAATSGLDAGDNWGAPTYAVREWLEAA